MTNEWEASTLLKPCQVNVVSIDSKLIAELFGPEITTDLKDTSLHAPVALVQTGNGARPSTMTIALTWSKTSQRFLQSDRG